MHEYARSLELDSKYNLRYFSELLGSAKPEAFVSVVKRYPVEDLLKSKEIQYHPRLQYILKLMLALKDPHSSYIVSMRASDIKYLDIVIMLLADPLINNKRPNLLEFEFHSGTISYLKLNLTQAQISELSKNIGVISFSDIDILDIMPKLLQATSATDNSCKRLKFNRIKVTSCEELRKLLKQVEEFNGQDKTQYSIIYRDNVYTASTADVGELLISGQMDTAELSALPGFIGNIEKLTIKNLVWYPSCLTQANLSEKFPALKRLELVNIKLNADDDSLQFFTQISRFPRLEELVINSSHAYPEAALSQLTECRGLRSLNYTSSKQNVGPLAYALLPSSCALKTSWMGVVKDKACLVSEDNVHRRLEKNNEMLERECKNLEGELASNTEVNISKQFTLLNNLVIIADEFIQFGYPSRLEADRKHEKVIGLSNRIAAHWIDATVYSFEAGDLPIVDPQHPLRALCLLAMYKRAQSIYEKLERYLDSNSTEPQSVFEFLKNMRDLWVNIQFILAAQKMDAILSRCVELLVINAKQLADRFVDLPNITTPDHHSPVDAAGVAKYFEILALQFKVFDLGICLLPALLLIVNSISLDGLEYIIGRVGCRILNCSPTAEIRFRLAQACCLQELLIKEQPGSDSSIALMKRFLANDFDLSNKLQTDQYLEIRTLYSQFMLPHLLAFYKKELEKLGLIQFSSDNTRLLVEILDWLSSPTSLVSRQRNNVSQIAKAIKFWQGVFPSKNTEAKDTVPCSTPDATRSSWFSWWRTPTPAPTAAAAAAVIGCDNNPSTSNSTPGGP